MTATITLENLVIKEVTTIEARIEAESTWQGFPVIITAYGKARETLSNAQGQQITVVGEMKPVVSKGLTKGLIIKAGSVTLVAQNDNNIVEVIQQILSEVQGNPKSINKDKFVGAIKEIEKVLA